jgi:RNA polymerase sigma-70 factor, ECF subfamily
MLERIHQQPGLGGYYLLYATAATFWRQAGDLAKALASYRQALNYATSEPERRFLIGKIAEIEAD